MPCKLTLGKVPTPLVLLHPQFLCPLKGRLESIRKVMNVQVPGRAFWPASWSESHPELEWHPALNWIAYHYFALVWQQIFALSLGRRTAGKKLRKRIIYASCRKSLWWTFLSTQRVEFEYPVFSDRTQLLDKSNKTNCKVALMCVR